MNATGPGASTRPGGSTAGQGAGVDLVAIPGGVVEIGSDADEIESCVAYWSDRLVDPSDRTDFRVWIEKEFPRHQVEMSPFMIGAFPVQNDEYRLFTSATGRDPAQSDLEGTPDDHPVWGVSYEDAAAYARWLAPRVGTPLRLPTEAEWEYVARGVARTEYPWGDEFDPKRCNTIESGIGTTTPVRRYPDGRSDFDVWDLSGNTEEWTSSFYAPYPGGRFVDDDFVHAFGQYRVLRGGSCVLGGDVARCARRHGPSPRGIRYVGFRLAADCP